MEGRKGKGKKFQLTTVKAQRYVVLKVGQFMNENE